MKMKLKLLYKTAIDGFYSVNDTPWPSGVGDESIANAQVTSAGNNKQNNNEFSDDLDTLLPLNNRRSYSIVCIKGSHCGTLVAAACSDGHLRVFIAPDNTGEAGSAPVFAKLDLHSGSKAVAATCICWEPQPPKLYLHKNSDLDNSKATSAISDAHACKSLMLLATTGDGDAVQCVCTLKPVLEPQNAPCYTQQEARELDTIIEGPSRKAENSFVAPKERTFIPTSYTDNTPQRSTLPSALFELDIEEIWRESLPHEQLLCCAYTPNGLAFAVAGKARVIYLYDNKRKSILFRLDRAAPDHPMAFGVVRETGQPAGTALGSKGAAVEEKPVEQTPASTEPQKWQNGDIKPVKPTGRGSGRGLGISVNPPLGTKAVPRSQQMTPSISTVRPAAVLVSSTTTWPMSPAVSPQSAQVSGFPIAENLKGIMGCVSGCGMPSCAYSDGSAHSNRIVQLLFVQHEQEEGSKHHQSRCLKGLILLSCGADNVIQVWNLSKEMAVAGTSETSPLGEACCALSSNSVIVASHRNERQLQILKLPNLDQVKPIELNACCICTSEANVIRGDLTEHTRAKENYLDEAQLCTQFYSCKSLPLGDGTVVVCAGGNRPQLRVYSLPCSWIGDWPLSNAYKPPSSCSNEKCICSKGGAFLTGIEILPSPPLSVDIIPGRTPPPKPNRSSATLGDVIANEKLSKPEKNGQPSILSPTVISSYAINKQQEQRDLIQKQRIMQQKQEQEAKQRPLSPLYRAIILVAVQSTVYVYGIIDGAPDIPMEFCKARQHALQRKQEEAIEAASSARLLQAHTAAAAAAACETMENRKGVDRDDEDRCDGDEHASEAGGATLGCY